MKLEDARHLKRERLRSGVKTVLERKLVLDEETVRGDLAPFFLREHHLCRLLAIRYAECVATALEGFPDGDVPADVLESHVDVLCFHDEAYAKKLFPGDDQVVRVLKGTTTVARRFYQWLDTGDLFTLGGRTFRVTAVTREPVGEVTGDEAKKEGAASLDAWRRAWVENLPRSAGPAEWTKDQLSVRHEFAASD